MALIFFPRSLLALAVLLPTGCASAKPVWPPLPGHNSGRVLDLPDEWPCFADGTVYWQCPPRA